MTVKQLKEQLEKRLECSTVPTAVQVMKFAVQVMKLPPYI